MAAGVYNFEIEKGAIHTVSFDYKDNNNNIIDLTNWCARFNMKSMDVDPVVTLGYVSDSLSAAHSFTITPSLGRITLRLAASTTQNFNFPYAIYDLDLKAPNELFPGAGPQIIKLLKGTINIVSSNIDSPVPFTCQTLSDPGQCINCE